MEIHKKCWPVFFEEVLKGNKKFEVRLADFNVEEGDILVLEEYNPETKEYTGRSVKKKINFARKWNICYAYSLEDIKKFGLNLIGFEENEKMRSEPDAI